MFEPLVALALFGGVVWVVARAIFMLLHVDRGDDMPPAHRDTIAAFVEENYGSHFAAEDPLGEERLRKL